LFKHWIGGGPRAVAIAFITLGAVYGVWFAYSVFLVALVDDMGWSRSRTAGAFSVLSIVHGFSGPLIGRLVERFGTQRVIALGGLFFAAGMGLTSQIETWWQLYLSFGVVSGIGIAMAGWIPFVVTVERWYPTRLGTALGFALSGVGFGILVGVPVVNALVEAYGWRSTFLFAAGIGPLWVIPVALLFLQMPEPELGAESEPEPEPESASTSSPPSVAALKSEDRSEQEQQIDGTTALEHPLSPSGEVVAPLRQDWLLRTALRSRRFWVIGACFFTGVCATQVLLIHQFAFMVDQGIEKTESSFIAGVVGLSSIAGQLYWGRLSDRIGREWVYTIAAGFNLLAIIALFILGWQAVLWVAVSFAIFIGLGFGANAPLYPAASRDLFFGPFFPSIYGALSVSGSLGAAVGAWLGGFLHDITGEYLVMLTLCFVLAILSPALMWLAAPRLPNPPPQG